MWHAMVAHLCQRDDNLFLTATWLLMGLEVLLVVEGVLEVLWVDSGGGELSGVVARLLRQDCCLIHKILQDCGEIVARLLWGCCGICLCVSHSQDTARLLQNAA